MLRRGTHAHADGQAGAVRDDMADPPDRWRAMLAAQAVPIYRWVYTQVGNREQAEELTARVFDAAAHEQRTRLADAPTSEAARDRLFQIARDIVADELRVFYGASAEAALDCLRRMAVMAVEEVERMTTDDTDSANLPAARAHDMLARLAARERELLTCRFLLGYPIERTAARLHLSVAETMALQFVALKHASELDSVGHGDTEETPKMLEQCNCH